MALKRIALVVLLYAVCGLRCEAQFVGFVGQQTVQQTLATNLPCTGSAQTFTVQNIGQAQHYLQIAAFVGAQTGTAEIDGIDNLGNVFRISDVLEFAGGTVVRQGTLKGSGYYPKIQVLITCAPNTATFSASYSGTQTGSEVNAGTYLTAQIDKINFSAVSATASQQDNNEQTPFGSSAGTLLFSYATAPATVGSLTVFCNTAGTNTSTQAFSVAPALISGLQSWAVPDFACPFMSVQYSPGTGGTTVSAEYVFSVPGISNRAGGDYCQSGTFAKQSAVVAAGAAATTRIVNSGNASSVYVCGYQFSQTATAGTVQWVYGTGATCGTGTTNLTGAMTVTANQPVSYSGPGTVMRTAIGNSLCMVATGAGGAVNGIVTYVLAP